MEETILLKGKLLTGVPFLAKNKRGTLYTPSFNLDSSGRIKGTINPNLKNEVFFTYRNGEEEIFCFSSDEVDETKKYKSLSLMTADRENKFLPLRAFGEAAKDIHLNYNRFDSVELIAKKSRDGRNKLIYLVIDIKKID